MKKFQTWTGREWIDIKPEDLTEGVQYIRVVLEKTQERINAKNSRVQEDTRSDEQDPRKEE